MSNIKVSIKLPSNKLGLENTWVRQLAEKHLEGLVKVQIEQLLSQAPDSPFSGLHDLNFSEPAKDAAFVGKVSPFHNTFDQFSIFKRGGEL